MARLGTHLAQLAESCSATEAVLFEKATFLVIMSYSTDPRAKPVTAELPLWSTDDATVMAGFPVSLALDCNKRPVQHPETRFERISELIKQFKLASVQAQHAFQALELQTSTMTVLLDKLTPNTYILVVVSDPRIRESSANQN